MKRIRKNHTTAHNLLSLEHTIAWMFFAVSLALGIFFASVAIFLMQSIQPFGAPFMNAHIPWYSVGVAVSMFFLSFAALEYFALLPSIKLSRAFILLLVIFFILSLFIAKTRMHSQLKMGRLRSIYSAARFPDTLAGQVVEVSSTNGMMVKTTDGVFVKVFVSDEQKKSVAPVKGDNIRIAGYRSGNAVLAQAINIF